MKAIEKKILHIEQTIEPVHPVKGRGHSRHPITEEQYKYLCDLCGRDYHTGGYHFDVVYARRSTKAKYNRMQFGQDEFFISDEMKKLFVRCAKSLRRIEVFG